MIKSNLLKVGDVIELKEGHCIYADIPRHFIYSDSKGDFHKEHHPIKIEGDFNYFAGLYCVYKTELDGGGGHGNDSYPDGHHVFCESQDRKFMIDFYQSGCFTAMIEDIQPLGKVRWTFEIIKESSNE